MERERIVEQLQCPLCKQVFKTPKQLPCGHNICQGCLKHHILQTVPVIGCNIQEYQDGDSSDDKPSPNSFKCPVDEKEVYLQNPNKDVSKWAYEIKNNLNIVTLVEIFRGKARGLMEMCDNCIKVSQNVAAVSVCFTCFEKYCVKCACIHRHTHPKDLLFNLSAVQNTHIENTLSSAPSEGFTSKETCKIHLFSELDLFCLDCKDRCCRTCQRTIHSECKHWHQLKNEQDELETNNTLTKLSDRLRHVLEKVSAILKSDLDLLDNIEKMKPSQNDLPNNQFKDMKNKLCCQISHWELHYEHVQRSLEYLNKPASVESKTERLFQTEIECQQVEKEVEFHRSHAIDNAAMLETFKDAYERLCSKDKEKCEKQSKAVNKSELSNIRTKGSEDFEFRELADLKTKDILNISQKIQLVDTLDMKAADDVADCWLTDCVFINDRFVIVADHSNMCLKWKLGIREVNKLMLPSGPQCIAVDQQHGITGCVTLPQDKLVQFFQIDDEKISLTDYIETKERCYGVGFMDSHIVVSSKGEAECSVKILTKDGEELKTISRRVDLLKKKLFCDPRYLTVQRKGNETRIYVTDFRLSNLTCLTLHGLEGDNSTETFIQHINGFPLSVDTDTDGNVLICINSKGEIRQLTDGLEQQHRLLVQFLWQPRAISFLKQGNKFIMTSDSGPKQNCVLLYEFRSRAC